MRNNKDYLLYLCKVSVITWYIWRNNSDYLYICAKDSIYLPGLFYTNRPAIIKVDYDNRRPISLQYIRKINRAFHTNTPSNYFSEYNTHLAL